MIYRSGKTLGLQDLEAGVIVVWFFLEHHIRHQIERPYRKAQHETVYRLIGKIDSAYSRTSRRAHSGANAI